MRQLMQEVKAEKQPANKNVGLNLPSQNVQKNKQQKA